MTLKLHLFRALKSNKTVIATFAALKGTRHAQAVIVDTEHGHIDDNDMHDMVCAISSAQISPLVRLRGRSPELIKRALDTGAHGIIAPMVNSAEEARAIVRAAKFPPRGERGQGSPFACFEIGLATPAEYVAVANDYTIVICQIETQRGIDNIDEICQVDGVDLVLIGPNDLALALLGHVLPAGPDEERFEHAVSDIAAAARRHGKKCGLVVTDGAAARRARERFDLIVLSNDVRALQAWYRSELDVARSQN